MPIRRRFLRDAAAAIVNFMLLLEDRLIARPVSLAANLPSWREN